MDEHGVAKGEEPVFLLHGNIVRMEDVFPARQSGYQHDQGALRQMEIGDQSVHAFELAAGIQEDIRPAFAFFKAALLLE